MSPRVLNSDINDITDPVLYLKAVDNRIFEIERDLCAISRRRASRVLTVDSEAQSKPPDKGSSAQLDEVREKKSPKFQGEDQPPKPVQSQNSPEVLANIDRNIAEIKAHLLGLARKPGDTLDEPLSEIQMIHQLEAHASSKLSEIVSLEEMLSKLDENHELLRPEELEKIHNNLKASLANTLKKPETAENIRKEEKSIDPAGLIARDVESEKLREIIPGGSPTKVGPKNETGDNYSAEGDVSGTAGIAGSKKFIKILKLAKKQKKAGEDLKFEDEKKKIISVQDEIVKILRRMKIVSPFSLYARIDEIVREFFEYVNKLNEIKDIPSKIKDHAEALLSFVEEFRASIEIMNSVRKKLEKTLPNQNLNIIISSKKREMLDLFSLMMNVIENSFGVGSETISFREEEIIRLFEKLMHEHGSGKIYEDFLRSKTD